MIYLISENPLVKKMVEESPGEDMIAMLLDKQLPFTELEYLETLVFQVKVPKYKEKAIQNLSEISDSAKISYVTNRKANVNVAYFILIESLSKNKNNILSKITQTQHLPNDFLMKIAKNGDTEILETLSENQIRLIAFPELIEAMESNGNLNNFTKGKLEELKAFYLNDEKGEEIKAEAITDEIFELASLDDDIKKEIKETKTEKKDEKKDKDPEETEDADDDEEIPIEEVQEVIMTRLQEINSMNVSDKIKTALLGTKADRAILIRDPNKLVSSAVIESPKVTADEISVILKNKSVPGDVIGKIAKNREWTKKYNIVLDLCMNPKTPVKDALGFLRRLHTTDLKVIQRDKNVSPVIRKFALQMQVKKD